MFVFFRVCSWLNFFLNFDINALSIQQPHQEQPEQDKADREGERGVDGREDRRIDVIHHPTLNGNELAFGAGDAALQLLVGVPIGMLSYALILLALWRISGRPESIEVQISRWALAAIRARRGRHESE